MSIRAEADLWYKMQCLGCSQSVHCRVDLPDSTGSSITRTIAYPEEHILHLDPDHVHDSKAYQDHHATMDPGAYGMHFSKDPDFEGWDAMGSASTAAVGPAAAQNSELTAWKAEYANEVSRQDRITKADWLVQLMRRPTNEADILLRQSEWKAMGNTESKFQKPDDLADNGWHEALPAQGSTGAFNGRDWEHAIDFTPFERDLGIVFDKKHGATSKGKADTKLIYMKHYSTLMDHVTGTTYQVCSNLPNS